MSAGDSWQDLKDAARASEARYRIKTWQLLAGALAILFICGLVFG